MIGSSWAKPVIIGNPNQPIKPVTHLVTYLVARYEPGGGGGGGHSFSEGGR